MVYYKGGEHTFSTLYLSLAGTNKEVTAMLTLLAILLGVWLGVKVIAPIQNIMRPRVILN